MADNVPSEENMDTSADFLSDGTADESYVVGEDYGDLSMAEEGPEFLPGDLMWGRVGNHPFWPCMILVDNDSGLYYKTTGEVFNISIK